MKKTLAIILVLFLASCAPRVNPEPTETAIPTATVTPITPTPTDTPTSTPKPPKTPIPIVYVTLGFPFAAGCGDGIPRIWSNDSFNAAGDHQFDEHHGHVDIFVPKGCNVNNYSLEVLAMVGGKVRQYGSNNEYIYLLTLPDKVYIAGIENAFKFAGIDNFRLAGVTEIRLAFGHLQNVILGEVTKGQPFADILPHWSGQQKIAYQVQIVYFGEGYIFTPTLFTQDPPAWICVPDSPYDCEPEASDYVK